MAFGLDGNDSDGDRTPPTHKPDHCPGENRKRRSSSTLEDRDQELAPPRARRRLDVDVIFTPDQIVQYDAPRNTTEDEVINTVSRSELIVDSGIQLVVILAIFAEISYDYLRYLNEDGMEF